MQATKKNSKPKSTINKKLKEVNHKSGSELLALLERTTVQQHGKVLKRNLPYAVIYTRVSSQEQAENNSSLESQLKLCREYASRQGLIVKETFGGTYESAKTDGRKEFTRMLSYVRKQKDIAYIIVYNFDRFSRTGPAAAQLSDDLRKVGIAVKSVSQDIDSSTASGRLQENMFHVFNHFDNQSKSERTATNTREVMLKGYWPYATPMGYKNLKPKHRACDHQYEITEEGKLLQKAFQWKGEGVLTNKEIIERLRVRGLRLTEKNFRWVLSNPFYAGYVTGKLVEGKLIEGKHPPLIDLETFLKANDLLSKAVNAGIAKHHKVEDLPLKIFAKEEGSGSPFTGYIKKGNWYYKARGIGVGVNISAKHLNETFEKHLRQFEYKKQYKEKLKKEIAAAIKEKMSGAIEEAKVLRKRESEVKSLLEKIEERFALGEITSVMYEKFAAKYHEEILEIEEELREKAFDSSNLEKVVEKGLSIAQNIATMWASSTFDEKQKLQTLVFPEGITYSKENDRVRTERVNALFALIEPLKQVVGEKKKGNPLKDCLQSHSVPRTGFEQN